MNPPGEPLYQSFSLMTALFSSPDVPGAKKGDPMVFDRVERGKINVAAFGLDDVIAAWHLEQLGNAKAGTGADDAGCPLGRQRAFGAAQMLERSGIELRHGVGDGTEVVDDAEPGNTQLLFHQ